MAALRRVRLFVWQALQRKVYRGGLTDHLQRATEKRVEISGERLVLRNRTLDRLLRCGSLIAEIDKRGQYIVNGWALHGRRCGCDGEIVQLVLEFNHQALGKFLADAGNAC